MEDEKILVRRKGENAAPSPWDLSKEEGRKESPLKPTRKPTPLREPKLKTHPRKIKAHFYWKRRMGYSPIPERG